MPSVCQAMIAAKDSHTVRRMCLVILGHHDFLSVFVLLCVSAGMHYVCITYFAVTLVLRSVLFAE